MGVIVTKQSTPSGGSGVFSQTEKLALQMEIEYNTAFPSYYKEFEYVPSGPLKGSLLEVDIWTDDTKTTLLFHKDFWYSASKDLSKTLLTRDSDGAQLLKLFEYTSGDLTSVTVSTG
jgi:hypothetical protein